VSDTLDLEGRVTRLDVEELDRWFKRVGRVAEDIERQLRSMSTKASDMVGADARLWEGRLLRESHDVVLTQARETLGAIASALRELEEKGRAATGHYKAVDGDSASMIYFES